MVKYYRYTASFKHLKEVRRMPLLQVVRVPYGDCKGVRIVSFRTRQPILFVPFTIDWGVTMRRADTWLRNKKYVHVHNDNYPNVYAYEVDVNGPSHLVEMTQV